jgi:hypothetical protein
MKRWISLCIVLLCLAVPLAAFAQSGSTSETGTGTLTAQGNGRASVQGNGSVIISGSGVLTIQDFAGDAVITVSGDGARRERGQSVIYVGFAGTAEISGSDVRVLLRGRNIDLTASGSGRVLLRGTGSYTINGESGSWSSSGITLELE